MEPKIGPGATTEGVEEDSLDGCTREVAHLSLYSLRVELRRRNLSTTGLRPALEARLVADLKHQLGAAARRQNVFNADALSRELAVQGVRRKPRRMLSVPKRFPEEPSFSARFAALKAVHLSASKSLRGGCAGMEKTNGISTSLVDNDAKSLRQFTGVMMGRSVWVMGQEQINSMWDHAGPCGKGNLSRSAPAYDREQNIPAAALKGRAMRQLLAMEEEDQLVAKDEERSDVEHLQFSLVEAYYASFVAKQLIIDDLSGTSLTDPAEAWNLFCASSPHFAMKFVAYSRYRTTGWLPRSGTKYGVDWVLYPALEKKHSHAPYCIVLQFDIGEEESPIERTWIRLQNKLRLVKNVAKTLVIANVHARHKTDLSSYETAFRSISVTEMTIDRWLP